MTDRDRRGDGQPIDFEEANWEAAGRWIPDFHEALDHLFSASSAVRLGSRREMRVIVTGPDNGVRGRET